MTALFSRWTRAAAFCLLSAGAVLAQTGSLEGDVKGPDGQPLKGALVKITRTDIKGKYQVKTDKKGHYFHAGLPLGTYEVTLEVDGKDMDSVKGVRTTLGDPVRNDFDLAKQVARQKEMEKAAETGQLTQEQARDMTPAQKAALEKQVKERSAAMAKNKALNDAFNQGMEAQKNKQYQEAVDAFKKASEMDPAQHVIWGNLADSYNALAEGKSGEEKNTARAAAMEAYGKALALKPDDASYHNNYALAMAKSGKFQEAQDELAKAAQIDPTNGGRYYYNLGAILVNAGQLEPAGEAFKKALAADPNYADAHYQYGVYLISKAKTTPDGKVVPPEGTRESFAKYLELKPDGQFADAAKGMLATMEGGVTTGYQNPNAKPSTKAPARKK